MARVEKTRGVALEPCYASIAVGNNVCAEIEFTAPGGEVIGKDQCKKLQSFIMSMDSARDLGGLFKLTTVG